MNQPSNGTLGRHPAPTYEGLVQEQDARFQRLLREQDVADICGVSLATVRRWRLQNKGPVFLKVSGAAVRYQPSALESYIGSRRTGGGK
jgi:predicted DNA-binding transcriptional regulator AlpA